MQTIPYCVKKLVTPVFKRCVLLKHAGISRSLCSVPEACYSSYLLRPSSSQGWQHVNSIKSFRRRLYSETCNESDPQRSAGVFSEESDIVSSQRSSVTFSLDVLVSLLRQENAVDICVIKVPEQLKYADYFIAVSGISTRHLRAMAFYTVKVYKFLKKDGEPNVKIEGKDAEDWMCIDFGNIVVHFMLPETREIFELEKLWMLRSYDEQLRNIPAETLPEDFIYDVKDAK